MASLRDQLPPDLQASYNAAVEQWRTKKDRPKPEPDDIEAIEARVAELQAAIDEGVVG